MRIQLPGCYPVHLHFSNAHWVRNGTHHGPKSNPRLFAAKLVDCRPHHPDDRALRGPSPMRRLWLYFRGGYACHFEFWIDRRPLDPPGPSGPSAYA